MGYFIAMIVGYVIGARAGGKDLDQLAQSVRALRETDEFGDVVAAARSHVGHTLRELASVVDGRGGGPEHGLGPDGRTDGDLVDRVHNIFDRSAR